MKSDRSNRSLKSLYARLDEMQVSPADRLKARAALRAARRRPENGGHG